MAQPKLTVTVQIPYHVALHWSRTPAEDITAGDLQRVGLLVHKAVHIPTQQLHDQTPGKAEGETRGKEIKNSPQFDEKFSVAFHKWAGFQTDLEMSGNMTVWEVKLMLQARGGVPAKQIVLFHKGDGQLPDDATVKEVGVRPGDFMTWSDIHTLLRVGHPEPEED